METIACMGGWCLKRSACSHYLTEDRSEPAERLCLPGHDKPVRVVRVYSKSAQQSERTAA